eukprot:948089-Pleurochrysis_carterae.AAC.2
MGLLKARQSMRHLPTCGLTPTYVLGKARTLSWRPSPFAPVLLPFSQLLFTASKSRLDHTECNDKRRRAGSALLKLCAIPLWPQGACLCVLQFFSETQSLVKKLSELPSTSCTDITGISIAKCQELPLNLVTFCASAGPALLANTAICTGVRYIYESFVLPPPPDGRADGVAKFIVQPQFDPNAPEGFDWYKRARTLLERHARDSSAIAEIYISGGRRGRKLVLPHWH